MMRGISISIWKSTAFFASKVRHLLLWLLWNISSIYLKMPITFSNMIKYNHWITTINEYSKGLEDEKNMCCHMFKIAQCKSNDDFGFTLFALVLLI